MNTGAHGRDRYPKKIYLTARIISLVPEVEMVASGTGKLIMYSPQHCLDQATECERSISSAQTEAQAKALRNISQSWLRLASQIDRYNALIREQSQSRHRDVGPLPDSTAAGRSSGKCPSSVTCDCAPCQTRAEGEGKMTKSARPAARPWTQADDDKLRALVLTRASTREIGRQLDRSIFAIRSRAQELHIILKKVTVKRSLMG